MAGQRSLQPRAGVRPATLLLTLLSLLLLVSSQFGTATAQSARYYRIGFHFGLGSDPDEEFIVKTSDPSVIANAEAQLLMPIMGRLLHVNGFLEYDHGSGRYSFDGNTPPNEWYWQFQPDHWILAEASTEICDGRPTTWDESNHFCPWSSFVLSHIVVAADFTAFQAQRNGPEVLNVTWTTAAEVDASHFEVQVTSEPTATGFFTVATEPAVNPPIGSTDYEVDVEDPAAAGWTFVRIVAFDTSGHYVYSDVEELDPLSGTPQTTPNAGYVLHPNRPNPFNPRTLITFDVPAGGGTVTLDIYDARGRRVRRLGTGFHGEGRHQTSWDGADERGKPVPSGTYFCCLSAAGHCYTRKLILAR